MGKAAQGFLSEAYFKYVEGKKPRKTLLIGKRSIYKQKLGAAATPFQLVLQNIKILPIRQRNQMNRMRSFLNFNFIPVIYFKPLLPVESQNDIGGTLNQPDFDVSRFRYD